MKQNIIIALLLFAASAFQASAQESTDEYTGFQWGLEARHEIYFLSNSMASGNASIGYRFNKKRYLGAIIGLGKGETYLDAYPVEYDFIGMPLLADYTRYFFMGRKKIHSFFLGAEAGVVLDYVNKDITDYNALGDEETVRKKGLDGVGYAALKLGFDFDIGKPHLYFGLSATYVGMGARVGITF